MGSLAALRSCSALEHDHMEVAASSANALRAFLAHVAAIARPDEGAARVLLVAPLLASASWLDGELLVELSGDAHATTLALYSDHGFGVRERIAPAVVMHVALDEFVSAVQTAASSLAPLHVTSIHGKLILSQGEPSCEESESITIAESSLHETERKTAPPPARQTPGETSPDKSGVHTHPTVRRMVAIRPEALRSGNDDD